MDACTDSLSIHDKRFTKILDESSKLTPNGHLEMPLPFKGCDRPILPSNERVALARLNNLKDKFKKDPLYFKDNCNFMEDFFAQGHARKLTGNELSDTGHEWYLPHHGVYNTNKPGKIRIV